MQTLLTRHFQLSEKSSHIHWSNMGVLETDLDIDDGHLEEESSDADSEEDEEGEDSDSVAPDDDFDIEAEPEGTGEGNDDEDSDNSDNGDSDEKDDGEEADNDESGDEEEDGNAGWADAMAKVLAMGKRSDKPVSVLSKAKKDNVKRSKPATDSNEKTDGASDSDEEEVPEKKLEPLAVRKAKKKELDSIGRSLPNVLDRNAEKALSRTATRGVVQLFNAVRDHQKDMKTKLKEAGGSFRKQEKVYKNLDKNSFVQMLTGKPISKPSGEPLKKKAKTEIKDEEEKNADQSTWSILRDDYMLGAKLKDWDKDSDDEK